MTKFIKHPNMLTIAPDFSGISIDSVPAGYWRISCDPINGFHLVPVDPLQVADKIYGSLLKHAPRIMEVFNERVGVPTTVMLEGLKGSGKSLLMKQLAKDFVEKEDGIVLLCNAAYTGDEFFEFLQAITQKKMVLMDEFDKVYSEPHQRNNILTLLDGTFASHTLFIITMNAASDSGKFEFFHNRPGRVFFNIKFRAVDIEAIEDYLKDHLDNQTRLNEVMTFIKRFTKFNMDMLGTLTREINACPKESLEDIAIYLNIKPDVSLEDMFFDVQTLLDGNDITNNLPMFSSMRIREFLTYLQRGETNRCSINVDPRSDTPWNVTKNCEWDVKTRDEDDEQEWGFMMRKGKKATFVPSFDVYIQGDLCSIEQDTATGVLTLKQKFDMDGTEREVTLVLSPQLIKRVSYF